MTNQTPTQKAQSLGWTQCDYPHKAAKDMWYHPDASICDEGRYVSEEEMLEFIDTSPDEEDFASLLAKGICAEINTAKAWRTLAIQLHDWIANIDILATNDKEDREWHGGEIGWVYQGMGAYYGEENTRQELLKQFAAIKND